MHNRSHRSIDTLIKTRIRLNANRNFLISSSVTQAGKYTVLRPCVAHLAKKSAITLNCGFFVLIFFGKTFITKLDISMDTGDNALEYPNNPKGIIPSEQKTPSKVRTTEAIAENVARACVITLLLRPLPCLSIRFLISILVVYYQRLKINTWRYG